MKQGILEFRSFDISWIFQVITLTVTLVAFIAVVDYFTSQASLEIRLLGGAPKMNMLYSPDAMHAFYAENNLDIPKVLHTFFAAERKTIPEHYVEIGSATPDIDIIAALKRGQKGLMLDRRIEILKEHLNRYDYKKRFYLYGGGGGYQQTAMTKILNRYEKLLSSQDFFFFLSAAIYSREVTNTVFVKNNGEVDLTNVELEIPAPTSKITESRSKGILDFDFQGSMPHKIELKENVVFVSLPMLRVDKFFGVRMISRENKIDLNEIYNTYKVQRYVNYQRLLVHSAVIFFIVLCLKAFFSGQNSVQTKIVQTYIYNNRRKAHYRNRFRRKASGKHVV